MAMEISNAYNSYGSSYINTTDSRKKQLEKYSCADESSVAKEAVETDSTTKKTAEDELSYLSKKYSNYSFVAANYTKGMRYGTIETTNIAISPQFLKKMADNPELEKEYESYFEGMQKLDEENIQTHEARGRRMVAQGWAIDKNGGISRWGISEPTNKRHYGQEMTDYANKLREQKSEKKREQKKIEERRQADREEQEKLQVMKDIRSQYGDNVIIEFSGDGMAKLVQGKKGYLDSPLSDEEAAAKAAKQAEFDGNVIQMENTHRIVIPNIQTNEKLYNSLAGADEEAVKAANGIIKNYFLPNNVSGMSEDERKAMIAFGMEEAKYIAENYLDKEHSKEFLSAMETIAKYGMNGTVAENGTVTYHIEKGLNSAGAVDDMDILKEKAPDLYNEINELNMRIINHKDGEKFGAKFLELHKRAAKVLDSINEKGETNRDAAVKEYRKWEEETEKTEIPDIFKDTKYTDIQSFFESLQNQSRLSDEWLSNSMVRFMKWLNG